MKKIDELGISQWPWECHKQFVIAKDDGSVVAASNYRDANLIAAAPELYECLREAVLVQCGMCKFNPCLKEKCAFRKWRAALERVRGLYKDIEICRSTNSGKTSHGQRTRGSRDSRSAR